MSGLIKGSFISSSILEMITEKPPGGGGNTLIIIYIAKKNPKGITNLFIFFIIKIVKLP